MLCDLLSECMAIEKKRLTIELSPELHEKFLAKCFHSKPRRTMRQVILDFIAEQVGEPHPVLIDRRKLTRDQRAAFDRGEDPFKPAPKPRRRP